MLSSKQLDDLIRAWPDENGVSSDPEIYAAWIRAHWKHAVKFIGMALGKKRLESLMEEQYKQLYDVYQKLLEERIISEIGDDEIIAHYEIVTQQKKLHWSFKRQSGINGHRCERPTKSSHLIGLNC